MPASLAAPSTPSPRSGQQYCCHVNWASAGHVDASVGPLAAGPFSSSASASSAQFSGCSCLGSDSVKPTHVSSKLTTAT